MDVGSLIAIVLPTTFISFIILKLFILPRLGGSVLTKKTGDALLILYDATTDSIEPYYVDKVTDRMYISKDGSVWAIIPEDVRPRFSRKLGKPVLLGAGGKAGALALNPRALSTIGIASIGIKTPYWRSTEKASVYDLLHVLGRYLKGYRGEIVISPETRLVITYDVKEIIRAQVSSDAERARGTTKAIRETQQNVEAMQRLYLEHQKIRVKTRLGILGYLVILLFVAGIVMAILKSAGVI